MVEKKKKKNIEEIVGSFALNDIKADEWLSI